jgi:hypothetical protein
MEPEQSVSSVYRSIIDDVVVRVKPEFVGDGVDECALAWFIRRPTSRPPLCEGRHLNQGAEPRADAGGEAQSGARRAARALGDKAGADWRTGRAAGSTAVRLRAPPRLSGTAAGPCSSVTDRFRCFQ